LFLKKEGHADLTASLRDIECPPGSTEGGALHKRPNLRRAPSQRKEKKNTKKEGEENATLVGAKE